MEEKAAEKAPEQRKHPHHRRRRPGGSNNNNNGNNSQNQKGGAGERRSQDQKRQGNGGYTKANQNPNRSRNKSGHNDKNSEKSHERSGERNRHSSQNRPRKKGYQPDTGKDAIRSFILGTYEEEDRFYVFSFDKGTYSIHKGAVPEIPEPEPKEEGEETNAGEKPAEPALSPRREDYFNREDAEEMLVTRDKVLAYQTWNDLKRPKKGRAPKTKQKEAE
ncbi:MAG: hypothetical protein IJT05_01950 [Lachnospiraceae bacterium]|nr:hypothetical protein [Lachnospiraceae bacterium]